MGMWKVGLASLVALMLWASAEPASARSGVRIGTLNCTIQGGVGLILGSRRNVTCVFRPSAGGRESYTGRITRVGLDIGVTSKARMVWDRLARR